MTKMDTEHGRCFVNWYDGDLIKNENAEIVRVKLDSLKLYPGISASDYINSFMNLSNELNKIDGKVYSDNHYKFLFLKNIEHPDYQVTKKLIKKCKGQRITSLCHSHKKRGEGVVDRKIRNQKT